MSCHRKQIDLLIPNTCWMDVASGKKICFHDSPGDPEKKTFVLGLCPSHLQKSFLTWSSTHVNNASFPGTLLWAQTSSVQNQPKTTLSVSKPFLCTFSLCLLLAEQQPTIFLLSSFCCQFTLTSLSQLQLSLDCCQLKQCFSLPTKYFSYLYLLSAPSFFF